MATEPLELGQGRIGAGMEKEHVGRGQGRIGAGMEKEHVGRGHACSRYMGMPSCLSCRVLRFTADDTGREELADEKK
jgi:hypothetical protein